MNGPAAFQAYDQSRDFTGKGFKAGCYAPYVSLYFNTVGDVVACCKNQTFVLGNVAESSLDAIWRGAQINQLRKALARYDFGAGCGLCEWQIKGGDHLGVYTRIFEEFPVDSETPQWPQMMEFTISNTCNFECVMCYGELSSLIRSHRDGLPPLPKVYGERFFSDLRKYLPHLKRAKFFGGEPFLAAENLRVWDMMMELGLKIPCHVTTNGSIWNDRVRKILDFFPVSISVSVDGATKATFDAVRVNGDFDVVMENVRRFLAYARERKTDFTLTHCLMRQNWHEFADFLLLAEGLGCAVWINTVVDPPDCSLFTLPPAELHEIANKLEEKGAPILRRLKLNRGVWDNQIKLLRENATERQTRELALVREEAQMGRSVLDSPNADWVSAAWSLIHKGQLREAIEVANHIPDFHTSYWHGFMIRAHALRALGEVAAAEQEIERSFKLTTRRPEPFAERAWIRLDQGRVEEGIADARKGLERLRPDDPTEETLQDALGALCTRKLDQEGSRAALDRLLALNPKSPYVRVRRAWAWMTYGLQREALAELDAALAIDPKYADAVRTREQLVAALGTGAGP